MATSTPPCLNENFFIIRRPCKADGWAPEPNCSYLQNELIRCPEGFTYLQEYDICYIITDIMEFPPNCPYDNAIPFTDYVNKVKAGVPIWVPVHRNVTNGSTGRLEWIEQSYLYGEEIDLKYRIVENLHIKNCLIYNETSYKAVYCNETYSAICAYKPLQNQENSYCQQKLNCFPADFSSSTTCFCVKVLEGVASRSDFCANFAEFIYPYQNVFPDNTCWIGLEKQNHEFFWSVSNELIGYSAWNSNTNFRNQYGATNSSTGWVLMSDITSLSCGICKQTITTENSKLLLSYDKNASMLVLQVYHSKNLMMMKCFTDTFMSEFKAKYPDEFLIEEYDNYTIYRYDPSSYGPGSYWCEAFQFPFLELIKSNAVFVHDRTKHGNEYVLWSTFTYEEERDPTITNAARFILSALSYDPDSYKLLYGIREMRILDTNETTHTSIVIVHITAKVNSDLDREKEFIEIQSVFDEISGKISGMKSLDKFLSSHFCYKAETFIANVTLHWDSTNVGYSATPNEICILENGMLARRNCEGNFIEGASWADFNESCTNNLRKSQVTEHLNDLLESNSSAENIINNLTSISEYYEHFEVIDIFLIARVLRKISEESVALNNTARIISNIIKSNRSVLTASQNNLNSTNDILYCFDLIMLNSRELTEEAHVKVTESNVIIVIAYIEHGVSGVLIRGDTSSNITSEIIYKNASWQNVLEIDDLIAAVYLPNELIQQLQESSLENPKLIITVFMEDALFNKEEDAEEINISDISKVFGVMIPEFNKTFVQPIQMLFKTNSAHSKLNKTCGFWKFRSSSINSAASSWVVDGIGEFFEDYTDYVLCEFWHVTHFAMLVIQDSSTVQFDEDLLRFLDMATDVNCGLSLFGVAGILFTALLFKNWRRNTGNQILINFVFAISLQIILLYVSAKIKEATTSTIMCICVGALLHYSVISEFCWMLVIAILQFKRFVQVFGGPPKWVLVKACVTGWVIPLLPVVVLLGVDPENYTKNSAGICYPSFMAFYLALLLPVALILVANIIIYIIILSDVFYKKAETSHCVNTELILQWRLVVLLFFMLGITWTFALLAYAYEAAIFLVLFCFTATLQGFILFMFFIVFNKTTRALYIKLFKSCCSHF